MLRQRNMSDKGLAGKLALFFSLFSMGVLKMTKRRLRSFHWDNPSYI
jgi:hypothetical protein